MKHVLPGTRAAQQDSDPDLKGQAPTFSILRRQGTFGGRNHAKTGDLQVHLPQSLGEGSQPGGVAEERFQGSSPLDHCPQPAAAYFPNLGPAQMQIRENNRARIFRRVDSEIHQGFETMAAGPGYSKPESVLNRSGKRLSMAIPSLEHDSIHADLSIYNFSAEATRMPQPSSNNRFDTLCKLRRHGITYLHRTTSALSPRTQANVR